MKKILSLITITCLLFACKQSSRNKVDKSAYDVINEKCYVYRESKPAPGPLTDSILQLKKQLTDSLTQQGFKAHMVRKDSLLFRRLNGQEVLIELPTPQDAWEANTIIVFDPAKNPLFVNLHKGTSQIEQYIKGR